MPLQERHWPEDLADAIGREAVARGNASSVWRDVNAGVFEGFPAFPVPRSTVRAYAAKERRRLERESPRPEPSRRPRRGTIAQKVDRVAHELIDMAADRVAQMRRDADEEGFDAGEAKDIAEILVKLRRSAPDRPRPEPTNGRKADPLESDDPLALALRETEH